MPFDMGIFRFDTCAEASIIMHLIDTHSHIDIDVFSDEFHEVLARARAAGVIAQILPGICRDRWKRLLSICQKERDLFPAIGMHPTYLDIHQAEHIIELQTHAQSNTLVAIGEIGLDYFVNVNRDQQQELFEKQLAIASETNLPILLHVRKAHDQVLSTIRKRKFSQGGIVHAFSGSMQQAGHYINNGFLISFGGSITYTRAKKLRRIAKELPLETIVLETDAPDLPPVSHHSERNYPEYLPDILQTLAELRSEPIDTIALITTQNASRLLQLNLAS